MGKYERATIHDELVDDELQGLGVKFKDHTEEIPRDAEFAPVGDTGEAVMMKYWRRCRAKNIAAAGCSLAATDGLLIYMCMAGKIELIYGLVFLAAASAFFGGRLKRASV